MSPTSFLYLTRTAIRCFFKKGVFYFFQTSTKTSLPTPREEKNTDSILFHRDAEMSSPRPFYYVPELEKMIMSRHRMAKEENKITFKQEVMTFLTGFIGLVSMTHGQHKSRNMINWIEQIIRKDKLGVWRLKRDGLRDLTLPFDGLQSAESIPLLEISRYCNLFNYIEKLVGKYHPERLPEWKELVEFLEALCNPVPLRTGIVQGSFPNISYYDAAHGHRRFDYAYELKINMDECNDMTKQVQKDLAREIQDLNVDFISMVALGKTNVCDGRKILKLFKSKLNKLKI